MPLICKKRTTEIKINADYFDTFQEGKKIDFKVHLLINSPIGSPFIIGFPGRGNIRDILILLVLASKLMPSHHTPIQRAIKTKDD